MSKGSLHHIDNSLRLAHTENTNSPRSGSKRVGARRESAIFVPQSGLISLQVAEETFTGTSWAAR